MNPAVASYPLLFDLLLTSHIIRPLTTIHHSSFLTAMSDLHHCREEEQGGVFPNLVSIPLASESLSMIGTDRAAATSDSEACRTEEPPHDPTGQCCCYQ